MSTESQDSAIKVTQANLGALKEQVAIPEYDRSGLTSGIVHIGVGGFHRSHLAEYVDDLLTAGVRDWAITGVGLLPGDVRMRDALDSQDGLYTLVKKSADGSWEPRIIGSIREFLLAPDDPHKVLDAMSAPTTRIVSLTITEGGYHVNQATGAFDSDDADIQRDLAILRQASGSSAGSDESSPTTAFGFIAMALAHRRAMGTAPFTVMSCDNIPGNGDVARQMLLSFVELADPELAQWIATNVQFPNSMVDRITPVTADADRTEVQERFGIADAWPVMCEPFKQWVLEDHFGGERPDFDAVGAQLVDDVVPYELMKLRLLNASHQALCYLGYLDGYRFAHEVCTDPLFVDFLLGYMEFEGSPTLPPVPGVDLAAYRQQLIDRFANPAIRDTLARLCAESSDRIPKWLVPVILEQLRRGGPVDRSALVVASWARYAEGVDEQGNGIDIVDQRADEVMARAKLQADDPLAFLRAPALFADLVEQEAFTTPYLQALSSLHEVGARATLEEWAAEAIG